MIKDRIALGLAAMGCVLLGVGIGELFERVWMGVALMLLGGSIYVIVLRRYHKGELEAHAHTAAIIHRALEHHRKAAEDLPEDER